MTAMEFAPLPQTAAWRHVDARDGFESVFLRDVASGHVIDGHTAAIEDGVIWAVHYTIEVDEQWVTQHCRAWSWSEHGEREVQLSRDAAGRWRVDGVLAPELDGCLDVDLESSACTNMLPVRRARLAPHRSMDAPAAYLRAPSLTIERLEQRYLRLSSDDDAFAFEYRSPRFGVECELRFAVDGLVLDYPGLATRVT
jgi:hypothetical protein